MNSPEVAEKPYQVMFATRADKNKMLALFISQDPEKTKENINKVFLEAAMLDLSDEEKQTFVDYLKSLSVEERQNVLTSIYDRMISNSCDKQNTQRTSKRRNDANEQ